MKRNPITLIVFLLSTNLSLSQAQQKNMDRAIMSEAYWKLWNPEVQAKIDRGIEKYRKAEAILKLDGIPEGTAIKVEQISHDFTFGANIFNFNQLGTSELNRKYKELFGTLFNAATIPFYWKKFEMQPNRPRFREEHWDTEQYWNQVKEPKLKPHWRRPATDPIVEYCESKGIRIHGHPLIWGIRTWHHPNWIYEQFCPENEKEKLSQLNAEELRKMTPQQIEKLLPVYSREMNRFFKKRIVDIANYYGGRIDSWDVVNESSVDYHGNCCTGDGINFGSYGLMPGDYAYKALSLADSLFPEDVMLNINDYANNANYVDQVNDLREHGCRIDIIGSQMHLFDPQQCMDIANGKEIETPEIVWKKMETLNKAVLRIHLSEITITSPGDDEHGRQIQSVIARNLYRLWFSIEKMMGITWWNVVDGCGAPGEPAVSGLFTRNMEPKPSFFALENLINDEWKTNMIVATDIHGTVKFRGFKGRYRVNWKNNEGEELVEEFYLKNDGDGF